MAQKLAKSTSKLPDCNQNFWQLGSIAGVAMGLSVMFVGGEIAKTYGAGTALTSVIAETLFFG